MAKSKRSAEQPPESYVVERVQTGAVTDFINVPPIVLFQVFNLADASICVGAVLLLLLGSTERGEPSAVDGAAVAGAPAAPEDHEGGLRP